MAHTRIRGAPPKLTAALTKWSLIWVDFGHVYASFVINFIYPADTSQCADTADARERGFRGLAAFFSRLLLFVYYSVMQPSTGAAGLNFPVTFADCPENIADVSVEEFFKNNIHALAATHLPCEITSPFKMSACSAIGFQII